MAVLTPPHNAYYENPYMKYDEHGCPKAPKASRTRPDFEGSPLGELNLSPMDVFLPGSPQQHAAHQVAYVAADFFMDGIAPLPVVQVLPPVEEEVAPRTPEAQVMRNPLALSPQVGSVMGSPFSVSSPMSEAGAHDAQFLADAQIASPIKNALGEGNYGGFALMGLDQSILDWAMEEDSE